MDTRGVYLTPCRCRVSAVNQTRKLPPYITSLPTAPVTRKHVPYTSATGKVEYTTSVLLIAALRRSNEPNARKTQRLVTAFGCKVPPEIEQIRDYDVPEWLGLPDHMLAGTSNRVFTETGPPAHIGSILGKSSADANGIAKGVSKDVQRLGADKNADDVP
jgi:hypothetical protein